MSEQWVQRAAQSIHEPVVLLNSSGAPITGIVYNTSGLSVQYSTDNSATWTPVTLVAGTVGVYTSGSWVERQNGLYQLDLPSTVYASTGAKELYVQISGVSGQVPSVITFTRQLVDVNPQDQFFGLEGLTVDAAQVGGVSPVIDNQGFLATVPGHPLATAPINATATTVAVDGNYIDASPWLMLFYPGYGSEIVAATAFSVASGVITFTITRGQLGTTAIDFSAAPGMFVIPLPSAAGVNATLPATVPSGYATSSNQTTIISQTTASAIASAVWNALTASYVAANSFGAWVSNLIASILKTPGRPIATDVNGLVTFNNTIPVPPTAAQNAAATLAAVQTSATPIPSNVEEIIGVAPTLTGGNINSNAVNAGGSGSGNGSVTVTVKSTASGTPVIPGATCSLNNSAGQQVAAGQTNASGQIVLSADAGTYTLLTTLSGQYGPVSQAFTMAVGTLNTADVSMTPVAIPTNTPANYCAMTGTTFANGVGTAGIPWAIQITALPSGFPAGNEESANMSGVSGVEGAIGTGTPPSVILPQGATYSIQIGSGAWLTGQIVPSTPNGLLPAAFG